MNRIFIILLCSMLVSCHTQQKVVYLQDAEAVELYAAYKGIRIQPKDILSIVISSKDPELVIAYNLPLHSYQAGSTFSASSYSQRLLGYLVDIDGYIDFPAFGKLKVSGNTREELSTFIKDKLIGDEIIKDAVVTVDFMNFKISVLGEVRNPSTFYIQDDRLTIFDALGRAGDLTIYGKRDNVLVQREENGKVTFYRLDLRSADIIKSPAFYLQQNDVVYVSPNKVMTERSGINENRTVALGVSFLSFLTNLAVLIVTIQRTK